MTQGELEKLALKTGNLFAELEIRIMSDIARRIHDNGFSTASADWQMTRLQQLGMAESEIKGWIKETLQKTDAEMEYIFSDEVYKQYYQHSRAYKVSGMQQIPFERNTPLRQLTQAVKKQLSGEYENLAASMGFAIRGPDGRIQYSPLMEFYRSTLDNAVLNIQSGAFSYETVLQRTVSRMTASGVRWVDYDSGVHNRIDVAARRAVLTGFRQVQALINEQAAADLGTDSYEVSYHVGARPSHQPWEGRVWTKDELVSVCGLGDVTGLCGANCYHDYLPFIPGVSMRTYTDEQLQEMIVEENTPKEYYGKQYTTYEALQEQRRREREIRATRQQVRLLQEGGADEKAIILKKARYQGQMQNYVDFSRKMGLPEQKARITQDGLRGRFTPTKAEIMAAGKKTQKSNRERLTLNEEAALIRYIGPESYALNDKLRRGATEELTELEKKWIKDLDSALDKLPIYEGNLNRSVTFLFEEDAQMYFDKFIEGQEYIAEQYLSTTKRGVYNDDAQIQIYIQNAKNGKDLEVLNDMENEVLYPQKARFKVVSKIERDGKFYILLEELE